MFRVLHAQVHQDPRGLISRTRNAIDRRKILLYTDYLHTRQWAPPGYNFYLLGFICVRPKISESLNWTGRENGRLCVWCCRERRNSGISAVYAFQGILKLVFCKLLRSCTSSFRSFFASKRDVLITNRPVAEGSTADVVDVPVVSM